MTFTEIISVAAIIISILSLLISFLNFRRDKYKVIVDLDWDNGRGGYYTNKRPNIVESWGRIIVRNEGRRPVSIRTVGIKYPDNERVYSLLEDEHSSGIKLNEHDWVEIKVPQDNILKAYAKDWKKLYAVAHDISGKSYKSGKPWNKPSWAE